MTCELSSGAIIRRAEAAIRTCTYLRAARVTVHFLSENGVVVIEGRVPSFFQKQLLQERIRRIQGVKQVENNVEVNSPFGD